MRMAIGLEVVVVLIDVLMQIRPLILLGCLGWGSRIEFRRLYVE